MSIANVRFRHRRTTHNQFPEPESTVPDYLTSEEVSDLLRTPKPTLYKWRVEGTGPPAVKVGRKLLYSRAQLVEWLDAQQTV
jgi:excisionase family DNA binding protein